MRVRLVVVLTILALLPALAARAAEPPAIDGPARVPTASDWATLSWGDALDFSNGHDLRLLADRTANVTNPQMADGRFAFDAGGSSLLTFVFPGHAGALPLGRDGAAVPIDADRFTHVSLTMSTSARFPVELLWDRCAPEPGQTGEQCRGRHNFIVAPGWHTYTLPLHALTGGQPLGWSGQVTALRLSLGTPVGAHVELDAVRIHEPPAEVTLRWDAAQGPLRWHREGPGDAVTTGLVGEGGVAVWPAGAYPAGTYRFMTADGAQSAPLVVDGAPEPVIDDPDLAGGEDYASAVTGNAWDFDGPDDLLALRNAVDVSFSGGVLAATNGGPAPNDPNFFLRLGAPIDTARYHRLTVRTRYHGPFGLDDAPGGGTHGRLSWTRADMDQDRVLEGNKVVQSKELVHYPDESSFTVDLHTDPPAFLMEDDMASRVGWPGSAVTHLRYDVNEDPGARRWTVDEIALRADDEAAGSFDVRWHDLTGQTASVGLYYDSDRAGFDGTRIVEGLTQAAGANSYRWDTTGVAPGRYWLYLVADDGTGTARTYASGPVVVRGSGAPAPGPGAALRIAGPDRIATGVALSQAAFPDRAPAVVVARDREFPDALAAAPLAAAAGGPLLLNPTAGLAPAVGAEVRRLGAGTVYVMGGQAAQSAAVETDLAALGVRVVRVAGVDRYATAAAAAEQSVALWSAAGDAEAGRRVLIARGTDFPDALAAGPLSGHSHQPLLLTAPDIVPPSTRDALAGLAARTVTVVGGPAAISDAVVAQLGSGGRSVTRLAGATRFDTAALAAAAAVDAGADELVLLVASGRAFPDALAAGPAVTGLGGVLLLSEPASLPAVTRGWVSARSGGLRLLRIAGGPAAIHAPVADELAVAAG